MADVVVNERGNALFYDVEKGEQVEVPTAQAEAAMAAGMVPETPEDVRSAVLREHYDRPVQAFLAGAGRGLTLGLSDVALTQSGMVRPETLAGMEQHSGGASGAGEIAGTVGSIFLPGGLLGQAGKAGAVAGRVATAGAARLTGKAATSLIPRLAGSAAAEGVAGLAIGTGHVASEMALKKREATLGAFAEGVSSYALTGAGIGAGLVGAGAVGKLALDRGRRVADRLGLNTKATRSMMQRHRELGGELEYLQKVPEAARAGRVESLQAEYEQLSRHLIVDKMARVSGAIVGAVAVGGVPGGIMGAVAGPRIMEAAKRYLTPLWERRGTIGAAWKAAGPKAVGSVARARPAIYKYGPVALDVAHAIVSPKKAAVHFGAEHVAPRVASRVTAAMQKTAGATGAMARPFALDTLTPEHVAEASQDIHSASPEQAAMDVTMSAPNWVERGHVDELADEARRGIAHLQSVAPRPPDGQYGGWEPTEHEAAAFNASLAGTIDPSAGLAQLRQMQVSPETIKATEAVHPAAMDEQRRVIRAEFERAVAAGKAFTPSERRQVATFLGDHRVAHPVHQPRFQAVLAQMSAGAKQEQGRMVPPRRSIRFAERNQSRAQAALEGKA